MAIRINLGAGSRPEEGWVNHDVIALPGIDITHDLDVFPWPWDDATAEQVRAYDVFEHVWHPLPFMRECWRVLQPGGLLDIHTVHYRSPNYHRDPDHRRGLDLSSFDYWVPGTELNDRYGAAYAQGCHYEKVACGLVDGMEIGIVLRKLA
jgi:SAM-dependent methyltransferase